MADPILKFFTPAGATINGLAFGELTAGDESAVVEVLLFNNKGGVAVVDAATDIRVSVLDEFGEKSALAVKEGFVLARSAGLSNPDNLGNFFSDNQIIFTPLTDVNELLIGNIPNNAARQLFFKLRIPPDATTSGLTLQFIAGHGSNTTPLPFFFDRAFGDGVVEEEIKHVFPSIFLTQVSTYSINTFLSGVYTGDENKDYIVRIVTAGTPGVAEYEVSDNNQVSFSSTIASGTNTFSNILTSDDVDEGVDIAWTTDIRLEIGDKFKIPVETRPFQFKAGATNTLDAFVGIGTALIANNRIVSNTVTPFNLVAGTKTFIFLDVAGAFTEVLNDAAPQDGKILLGWFLTGATNVIDQDERFPTVTLGLDLFDDFTPLFDRIDGLVWEFFQGRFRKFNEVIRIPVTGLIGTVSLVAGLTNFVQVDPIAEQVVTSTFDYLPDHIPLFRVKTGPQFVEAFEDDRAEVGVAVLNQVATFTTSSVSTGLTTEFDFTGFTNRALIRTTTLTPSAAGSGYTVTFYERDTKSSGDTEYEAGVLPNPFTDDFLWFHHDRDNTRELHGIILNDTGVTQTFTIDLVLDRWA